MSLDTIAGSTRPETARPGAAGRPCQFAPATLTVGTRELNAALTDVLKVMTPQPIPLLRGVLLRTADGDLLLTGTGQSASIVRRVRYTGDAIPATLAGARLLAATVKRHDPVGHTTIIVDAPYAYVNQGRRSLRLPTMPAGDYPQPPHAPRPAFQISGEQLARITRRITGVAAKEDGLRPVLTRVFLLEAEFPETLTHRAEILGCATVGGAFYAAVGDKDSGSVWVRTHRACQQDSHHDRAR